MPNASMSRQGLRGCLCSSFFKSIWASFLYYFFEKVTWNNYVAVVALKRWSIDFDFEIRTAELIDAVVHGKMRNIVVVKDCDIKCHIYSVNFFDKNWTLFVEIFRHFSQGNWSMNFFLKTKNFNVVQEKMGSWELIFWQHFELNVSCYRQSYL